MKLRRQTFIFIESELIHYQESMRELQRLRDDIISGKRNTDENIGGSRSSQPSEDTANRAIALIESRQIQQLERITNAIQTVTDKLTPEKKRLVQMKYWARPQTLTWDGVAYSLNVSRMTVLRWRREIIHAISEMTGLK